MPLDPSPYLGRRTLILGDVKTGKTARTRAVIDDLVSAGHGAKILVLDLAPEIVRGVGGKLKVAGVAYRTTDIVAPRLTGESEAEVERLASQNAGRIEVLFAAYAPRRHPILVVNDASLYLQAGDPRQFTALLQATRTAVVNAYRGASFADSAFSRRERRRVEALAAGFERVIRLPGRE